MDSFEKAKSYFLEGLVLLKAEMYIEAEINFENSLLLMPERVSTITNLAAVKIKLKKNKEGRKLAILSITLDANNCEGYLNLGLADSEDRLYQAAIRNYDKAIELKPDYAEAWGNKGVTLNELKRFAEALTHFAKAISLKPDLAEAWCNRGNALNDLKRHEEALISHDRAIELKPDYAKAYSNKGNTLHDLKRHEEALISHDRAIELKPDHAESWSNKGNTLYELKRFDEALVHYDQALSLKPDYAEACFNKGVILNELKRYDEAIAHYDQALSLKPDIDWGAGDLLHTKMKICSWLNLADSLGIVSKKVMANEKVIRSFPLLALNDDAPLHKKCTEIYAQSKYPLNPELRPLVKRPKSDKIRVGYFSADFRNHAVSILTVELFELHDKNRFEIIAFSFGADDKSPLRFRLTQAFDRFIDVSRMSDLEIAKLARELNIEIAVDLGGHTAASRTGIFADRAAPIQLSYLGYLGTLGVEYYDYLVADKTLIPTESQAYYSEKVVYLLSYQVNDRKRVISERQFTRQELGLPEQGFVFCCFNNNYKILPPTFAGWMRILRAVEGSVIFLYVDNPRAAENLKKEAAARGINSSRLVFGARIPTEEYLARYRTCDLFLDTFPYNAGTTASDALWAGLPVLTLLGESFASRVAASLLNAIGLPELITKTQEAYEAMAIELAMNPLKLEEIKLKLAKNRLTTPLFDTPLFTKNLEAAYTKMQERYQADLQPEHLSI